MLKLHKDLKMWDDGDVNFMSAATQKAKKEHEKVLSWAET